MRKSRELGNSYYSIHGIIGVDINGNYPWIETLQNDLPKEFKTDKLHYLKCKSFLVIKYEPKPFKKRGKNRFFIDKSLLIDYKFGCKVEFLSSQTIELSAHQECNEWMMFSVSYLLNINDYSFLHAACFKKDDACLLIPSGSGAGKTMITIDFVKNKGFSLLGDDLCIVDKKGNVYSYPKKMVLYPWHLGTPGTKKKLCFSNSFKETAKSLLRKFPKVLAYLRKNNPNSKTVSPYAFFGPDKIADNGTAAKLVYLERDNGFSGKLSNEEIIAKSYLTIRNEIYHYFVDALDDISRNYHILKLDKFYYVTFDVLASLSKKIPFLYINIDEDIKGLKIADVLIKQIG